MPIKYSVPHPKISEMMGHCFEVERVEAKLGKEIYDVFNGAGVQQLRKFAANIFEMVGTWSFDHPESGAFKAALAEESALRLWQKVEKTIGAFQLYSNSSVLQNKLDATDIGDLIRFAGCWVEKGGASLADEKEAFRPGVAGMGKDSVWSQAKINEGGKRVRGAGWRLEPQLMEFVRDTKGFSGMGGMKGGGAKRTVSGSNLSKLNRLFGLTWGCDISGTTSDEIFALSEWGNALPQAYFMLPLGLIVHNMHHTILEVALPLMLNDKIDYKIGFYDSLIPAGGLPVELVGIEGAITNADGAMHDKHVLRFFKNSKPAGFFKFEAGELGKLKTSPLVDGKRMLELASNGTITEYPSEAEVTRLILTSGKGFKIKAGK